MNNDGAIVGATIAAGIFVTSLWLLYVFEMPTKPHEIECPAGLVPTGIVHTSFWYEWNCELEDVDVAMVYEGVLET